MHMHVLLREGNGDTFLIEALLNGLLKVKEDTPVVLLLAPRADIEVHAAVGEFGYHHLRSGIVEDAVIGVEHVENDILNPIEIIGITHAHAHVHATGIFGGDVGDGTTHDSGIGNHDFLVIATTHVGHQDANFPYATDLTSGVDDVTHLEWAKQNNQHTGGEIG